VGGLEIGETVTFSDDPMGNTLFPATAPPTAQPLPISMHTKYAVVKLSI
jgi:hypothetical protein